MLEAIAPHAAIISAGSALISTVAVLISTGFIIWTTCFRKTRQDRIDDLMEEMQILLFDKGITGFGHDDIDWFFGELAPKFQKEKYRKLHRYALNEMVSGGRIRIS